MILTVYTETVIDIAHSIRGYNGNCQHTHGHTQKICVWVRGDSRFQDKDGILFDFNNVKKIKEKYDHKLLNEIEPFDKINPTAENICQKIYFDLKKEDQNLGFKVRVYETYVGKETYCECGDFE
jgi:6-pyruvoyltetrahydropterin/6-carboxytetrahydropterin synthase